MRKHYLGLHLIYILTAGATATCSFHLYIGIPNLDIDRVINQWVHKHRCERSMPSCIAIKWGDTDQAMHPAFRFQETISKRSIELKSSCFNTGSVTPDPIQLGHLPSLPFAIHAIHPRKHLRPVLALG